MNIANDYPHEARRLRVLLGINFALLLVGIVSPIVTLKKFILVENTFSILSGVMELLQEGKIFLFVLIAGFSVVIPLLKLVVLSKLVSTKESNADNLDKHLHWMHLYGKWSMLDVFIVAVMVVVVKLGAIASVEMRYGLYLFAAAVILTMYITARVVKLADSLDTADM